MQVGPNRVHAVQALLHHQSCDVIISDDGLQHYAMARDLEILVVDGQRRFGNGRCLPAGPLREPPARQWEVDFRVTNGTPEEGEHGIQSRGDVLCNLADAGQKLRFDAWAGKSVHGVCGIGNPQRFFDWLRQKGLNPVEHAFPDHYDYRSEDLEFGDDLPVIMTEKDAVKCQGFANARHWYAPIALETNQALALQILTRLKEVVKQNG